MFQVRTLLQTNDILSDFVPLILNLCPLISVSHDECKAELGTSYWNIRFLSDFLLCRLSLLRIGDAFGDHEVIMGGLNC